MSASPSLARRGIRIARRALNPSGKLPRRGYAHCFIEEDGVHSRLHLHNFYSLFLPDIRDPVDVHVRVYGADGRNLGTVSRRLAPFTSLTLPMADVLKELHASAPLRHGRGRRRARRSLRQAARRSGPAECHGSVPVLDGLLRRRWQCRVRPLDRPVLRRGFRHRESRGVCVSRTLASRRRLVEQASHRCRRPDAR